MANVEKSSNEESVQESRIEGAPTARRPNHLIGSCIWYLIPKRPEALSQTGVPQNVDVYDAVHPNKLC